MTDPTDITAAAERVRAYLEYRTRALGHTPWSIDGFIGADGAYLALTATDLRTLLAAVQDAGRVREARDAS